MLNAARPLRRLHRLGAALIAAPLLVIILTGMMLHLRSSWGWVQPPTQEGSGPPAVSFEQILATTRQTPEMAVQSWADVGRVDARPGAGVIKVLSKKSDYELQLDAATGKVLQVAYRRLGLIEHLHEGSWFHKSVPLAVFLPVAFVLLGLWGSGLYLLVLPWLGRRAAASTRKAREAVPPSGND